MKKQEKGITLIALVVTIVVLLILAAVSISMLGGENGIITQAIKAQEENEIGEEKEKVQLAATAAKGQTNWEKITYDNLSTELDKNIGKGKYVLQGDGPFEVTYNDSKRTYIVEENGNVIDKNEYDENKSLKLLINSGEDGIVYLPFPDGMYVEYIIDWGDGTTSLDNSLASKNEGKIASLENIVVGTLINAIKHTYGEKNKEYVVTITGKCDTISTGYGDCTPEKIIEILQWGETGLENIRLSDCTNLRKIASPSKNSFINLTNINYSSNNEKGMFSGCTSLTSVPEDLFVNCPNVQDFTRLFEGCTNLTEIPENLFSNCPNAQNLSRAFSGCVSLTAIPEKLFTNCPNIKNFSWTFAGCISLTSVPEKLFENCTKVEEFEGIFDGCTGLPF